MFETVHLSEEANIKVVGVGGGGCNAVNEMISRNEAVVEFIAVNSDAQALKDSSAQTKIQIGKTVAEGLGCGALPEVGAQAAQESAEEIREALDGANMIFIAAGMGGGTGTGASPVIAQIAKEMGILTVAVVTKPFVFEGNKRTSLASSGIELLRQNVDSLIVVENSKLLSMLPKGTTLIDALAEANSVLCNAVFSISELISTTGLMNVDFADVQTVMKCKGRSLMGVGVGSGENRALMAAENAIECPLLEDYEMKDAKGFLCTITHGLDFGIDEMGIIGERLQSIASPEAVVVIGTVIDNDMTDQCAVTVIATGLDGTGVESSAPIQKLQKRAEKSNVSVEVEKPQAKQSPVHRQSPIASTAETVSIQQPEEKPLQADDTRKEPTLSDDVELDDENSHLASLVNYHSSPLQRFSK